MKPIAGRVGALSALAAVLALGGCRNGGGGDVAQVRLINAAPDPGALSVSVDRHTVWKRSPYRDNSGYQKIRPGTYDVQVASAAAAASKPIAFDKGGAYTVLALNAPRLPALTFRVFPDGPKASIPGGKARVCFINAAAIPGGADLLLDNIVAFPQLAYGHRSEALLLAGGRYDVRVNPAGRVSTLAGPVTLSLSAGRSYTLVVMGQRPADMTLEVYPD